MKLHNAVIWHEDQGNILILFENQPIRLKGSAIDIWKILATSTAVELDDIRNQLVVQYPNEDVAGIERDVREFLSGLASIGILIMDEGEESSWPA